MATRSCTYNGMANFNGGWSPSSGYSKTLDGYIGDGGGYGVALKFAVPSCPGRGRRAKPDHRARPDDARLHEPHTRILGDDRRPP